MVSGTPCNDPERKDETGDLLRRTPSKADPVNSDPLRVALGTTSRNTSIARSATRSGDVEECADPATCIDGKLLFGLFACRSGRIGQQPGGRNIHAVQGGGRNSSGKEETAHLGSAVFRDCADSGACLQGELLVMPTFSTALFVAQKSVFFCLSVKASWRMRRESARLISFPARPWSDGCLLSFHLAFEASRQHKNFAPGPVEI